MPNPIWRRWLTRVWRSLAAGKPRRRDERRARLRLEDLESRLTPTSPSVLSINRANPAGATTGLGSVSYTVTFDQSVTGVDNADFKLSLDGSVQASAPTVVGGSGSAYTVAVNGIHGNGTLRLDLIDNDSIQNGGAEVLGGSGLANGSFQGQGYSILQTFPFVTAINRNTPAGPATSSSTVSYTVQFNELVTGVDPTDFQVVLTGGAVASTPVVVTGSGLLYQVAINGIGGGGTLGLNLVDDGSIRDLDGNPLRPQTPPPFNFQAAPTVSVGKRPFGVAMADLTHDGKTDLVVTNSLDDSLGILLGNGNGTFQTGLTLSTGTKPTSVAIADFDGDGNPDLVATDQDADNLAVFHNTADGAGHFTSLPTLTTGAGPVFVTTGDLNNDGKADIIVVNQNDGSLSSYLGNGNGTFVTQAPALLGSGPFSAALADVNGDGKLDAAVANYFDSNVGVLLGNGDGTFQEQATFAAAAGGGAIAVTAGDVNFDGKADLVVANSSAFSLSVLLGNGNGTFQATPNLTLAASPFAVTINDLNGDGKPDLSAATYNSASVLLGSGTGAFQGAVTFATGAGAYFLASGDVNGDGKIDLAVANAASYSVSVLLGNIKGDFAGQLYTITDAFPIVQSINRTTPAGPLINATSVTYTVTFSEAVTGVDATDFQVVTTGTLTTTSPVVVSGSGAVYQVTVNGISGNGTLGLNLFDNSSIRDGTNNRLIPSTGAGAFQTQVTFNSGSSPRAVATADMNGDGRPDIVTANGGNFVSILLSNGNGSFQAPRTFYSASYPISLVLADLNGDGPLDVGVAEGSSAAAGVLLGNGNGTLKPQVAYPVGGSTVYFITAADFNNDNKLDLALPNYGSGYVSVLMGNGNGTFQTPINFASANSGSGPLGVTAADVNHDGKMDIGVANYTDGALNVHLGNGNGTFQAKTSFATGGSSTWMVGTGDVNADGNADFALANASNSFVTLFLGNGNGTFKPRATFATTSTNFFVLIADVNGDGKPDLTSCGGYSSTNVNVMVGNGDGTFAPRVTFGTGTNPYSIASADLNGDSRSDLVTANRGTTYVSVLFAKAGDFTGQVYQVDQIAPFAQSINRNTPPGPSTSASTLVYTVTFNESVTGVDASDFQLALSGVTADPTLVVAGSGASYTVTITNVTGDGSLGLNLLNDGSIHDPTNNLLASTFTGQTYTILPLPPSVTSINRTNPAATITNASSVTYTVTFSENVTGVDPTDFQVAVTGTVTASPTVVVSGSNAIYTVTVNSIAGNGTLGLNLVDNGSVRDTDLNNLAGDFTGQVYSIDQIAPIVLSLSRLTPAGPATSAVSVTYALSFSEPVIGLDSSDFAVVGTGGVSASSAVAITGSGTSFQATVNNITGSGTLGLNLVDNGSVTDLAGNKLGQGGAAYGTPTTNATGNKPYGVVSVDVNGDSKLDLITVNNGAAGAGVLLGNGNGTFQGVPAAGLGANPFAMVVADVNNDTKVDLVMTSRGSNLMGTLLGNGNGTFQGPMYVGTATGPTQVIAADLNNDGNLDLAVANSTPGTVSVFLGNGNGTYVTQSALTVGAVPTALAAGDVNGDTKPDLIVASSTGNTISLLLANGNGTFQSQATLGVAGSQSAVTAADVSGDGKTDLILAYTSLNRVGVLLGNANATFQASTSYAVGTGPDALLLADATHDGKQDLVVTNAGSSTASVLVGNGNGTYQDQVVVTTGSTPLGAAVGDFNSDNKTDLIVANSLGNNISIFLATGGVSGPTYLIDHVSPTVQSIVRTTPAGPGTNASTVVYTVTFSEPVTGVDASDFRAGVSGTVGEVLIQATPVSSTVVTVTVSGVTGTGSLGLNIVDNGSIHDLLGNTLVGGGLGASFQAPSLLSTGASPRGIVSLDVNGDGKPDVITANHASYDISLFLGNGDGSFQGQRSFPLNNPSTNSRPYNIAVGDFNGDSRMDLAVDSYSLSDLSILLSNGNGTFQSGPALTFTGGPVGVTAADVNNDGFLDLVTPDWSTGRVGLSLGNGNGTFQAHKTFTSGAQPYGVVVADMNGDGKPDIAVANAGNNNIGILLGNGDGAFQAQKTFTTGSYPFYIIATDVNGDGFADLATANRSGANVSLLIGNGNGTFKPQVLLTTGSSPLTVQAVDVNSDSKIDLVSANSSSGTVSVLIGNGNGTFQGQISAPAGSSPWGVTSQDFNADGKPDLAVAAQSSNSVTILLGNGNGSFQQPAGSLPNTVSTGYSPRSVSLADVSGDGKADVTVANFSYSASSSGVGVLLGNGNGSFQAQTTFAAGRGTTFLVTVDVSGDGKADAIVANRYDNNLGVLLGNGNGTFQSQASFAVGTQPLMVTAADVNGDSKLDLVATHRNNNFVSVLLGNGNGTFQDQKTFATGSNSRFVDVADLNGDGKPDLVAVSYYTSSSGFVSLLLGNGNGTFQAQTILNAAYPIAVHGADLNGDGKVDLAVLSYSYSASYNPPRVNVLLGNGNATFQAATTFGVSQRPTSFAFADMSGDGKLDIAVTNQRSGTVGVLFGNGNGTFSSQNAFVVGSYPRSVAVGDINGDGRPDLAAANTNSGTVSLLINLGTGSTNGPAYIVDHTAPFVQSIVRTTPAGFITSAPSVTFTVTFSEAVTGVDPSDFQLALTGTLATALPVGVTGSGAVYVVTVTGIVGNGTLGLNLADNASIRDVGGNPLTQSGAPLALQAPVTVAAGAGAIHTDARDLNGDGFVDLVVANENSSNVGILFGNGNGTFQAQATIATAAQPYKVVAVDINLDGKLDLVTVSNQNYIVESYLGNGNGTFQARQTFETNSGARGMVVADVNLDGKPDVVTASSSTTGEPSSVLLGNGNGTFQARITFAIGSSAFGVDIGDLNADGKPDLAIGTLSNTVGVLLGNGNGTFQGTTTYTVSGSLHRIVAIADLNGDGKADLAVSTYASLTSVLLGNGNGSFQSETTFTGLGSVFLAVADINQDGKPDLVTSRTSGGGISLGNGNGTFQSTITFATGNSPRGLSVADFNGDGRPDIAVANNSSANLSILLNTTNGNLTGPTFTIDRTAPFVQSITRTTPPGPTTGLSSVIYTVTFSEPVTGVDALDFQLLRTGSVGATTPVTLTGSGAVYSVTVFNISGTGTLGLNLIDDGSIHDVAQNRLFASGAAPAFQVAGNSTVGSSGRAVATGDFNADGKADLAVANFNSNNVSVLLGNGNGTVGAATNLGVGPTPAFAAAVDVNNDGKLDLITANRGNNSISVLLGNGNGTFQAQTTLAASTSLWVVATGDVNGDGKADLISSSYDTSSLSLFLGNGNGSFQSQLSLSAGSRSWGLTAADFNGDGKLDLAVAPVDGVMILLLGNGNATFAPQTTFSALASRYVLAADLNADGKPDLATPGGVFLSNGNGSFQSEITFAVDSTLYNLAAADVNGDGKLDLAVVNRVSSNNVRVLLGNGNGAFQSGIAFSADSEPRDIAVGDFNGDGRIDLTTANVAGGAPSTASLLLNVGNGNFTGEVYTISHINHTPGTPTDVNNAVNQVAEGSAGGTLVGVTAQATDSDLDILTYSLQDDAGGRFTINPSSGVVSVANGAVFDSVGTPSHAIIVRADDGAGGSTTATFNIAVTLANHLPTLDPLSAIIMTEEGPQQVVTLTGIGNGGDAGQSVSVTATSSDVSVIANPVVSYTSGNSTGSITFQPLPNANTSGGLVSIQVTVTDNGGGVNSFSRGFTVTINPINDAPTIVAPSPVPLSEDALPQTITLTGISAGPANEAQTLTITALSSDTTLIPYPVVNYTNGSNTGTLNFTPSADRNGTATITLTVNDGGGVNNTATAQVVVTVGAVNDAPTLDSLPALVLVEDGPAQTVLLSGITAGPADEAGQSLGVTAVSSNTALILNPTVFYSSSQSTGAITFQPAANGFGTTTISVTVNDGQGTNFSVTRSFVVTVNPVNDEPTVQTPPTLGLTEDAGAQVVTVTGIGAGPGESQTLTVTTLSSNTDLIPNPTLQYSSPDTTGTLTFTPVADATGTATITITVNDGGGMNNLTTVSFLVTVDPANDAPTLNPLSPRVLNEDAGIQLIQLSGITPGPANEVGQILGVTAESSNTALIPNPSVNYLSPGANGSLSFQPLANAFGTTTITVTVNDGSGINGTFSRSFTVTVQPINDAPTLLPLADVPLNEDAAATVVTLQGISAGPGESQPLVVTATSSNPAIVPHPTLAYASGSATGTLTFTPVADANGSVTITVTVNDGGGYDNEISQSFVVNITALNDLPTLNSISDLALNEDAGIQTVPLSGIAAGPANETESLNVTAVSSNTGLIPNPTVTYTGSSSTGSLTFTPVSNVSGTATITVTVNDGQGINFSVSHSFVITVAPVNDVPTLGTLADITMNENDPTRTVGLSAIGSGAPDEAQSLIVTAVSSNPALILNPHITYTSPQTTGILTFTPTPGASGTATITVTVNDGGGFNNETSHSFIVTVLPMFVDSAGRLVVDGTNGNDTITITESATDFTVSYSTVASSQSVSKSQATGRVVIRGQGGNDQLVVQPDAGFVATMRGAILIGGDGLDTLTGGSGADLLLGGFGADQLLASDNADVLIGGHLDSGSWNYAALDVLASQWAGSQDTSQEAAILASLNDTEVDALTGGLGADWFFVRGIGEGDPLDLTGADRKTT